MESTLIFAIFSGLVFFLGLRTTGFAIVGTPWSVLPALRSRAGRSWSRGCRSERGLVRGAARCRRRPRVVVETAATAGGAATAAAARALSPGDLGRRVTQRGAHLVDLELDDRALLALAGLVRALDEPALHDHPHPLGQGLGDVLGSLAPDGAAHEQRVAVLPFVALLVETARGGRDGEVRDRRPRWGEAQLGVAREVPDHRDDGVTSHASSSCVL